MASNQEVLPTQRVIIETRKVTPGRPLYNEYRDAHSSITSGSTRNRPVDPQQDPSAMELNSSSNHLELDNLLLDKDLLADLKSTRSTKVDLFSPAFPRDELLKSPQGATGQKPLLGSLKKALGSKKSAMNSTTAASQPHTEDILVQTAAVSLNRSKNHPGGINESSEYLLRPSLAASRSRHGQVGYDKKEINDNSNRMFKEHDAPSHFKQGHLISASQCQQTFNEAEHAWMSGGLSAPQSTLTSTAPIVTRNTDLADIDAGPGPDVGPTKISAFIPESVPMPGYPTSSMGDGSTVEDIVRQYARDDTLYDIGPRSGDEDSEDEGPFSLQLPTHAVLEHVRSAGIQRGSRTAETERQQKGNLGVRKLDWSCSLGKILAHSQPPSATLPSIPSIHPRIIQRQLPSSSNVLDLSSSYGDTRDILEMQTKSQYQCMESISIGDDHSEKNDQVHPACFYANNTESTHLDPCRVLETPTAHIDPSTYITTKLPMIGLKIKDKHNISKSRKQSRTEQQGRKLRRIDEDKHNHLTSRPQYSIERDVSLALHRQSHQNDVRPTNGSLDHLSHDEQNPFLPSSTGSVASVDSRAYVDRTERADGAISKMGFYVEGAIPRKWMISRSSKRSDNVRVPIQEARGRLSEPESDDIKEPELNVKEDHEDWETVIDSRKNSHVGDSLYGDTELRYYRTGSSVADYSSNGDISDISPIEVGLSHFSSTDRIIAHPSAIHGASEYRSRDNTLGVAPVLMPSYKDHGVNGFIMNSSRLLSRPRPPMPMPSRHPNPFKSSPPLDMSPAAVTSRPVGRMLPGQLKVEANKGARDKTVDEDIVGIAISRYGPDDEHSSLNAPNGSRTPVHPIAVHTPQCGAELREEPKWVQASINGGSLRPIRRDRTPLMRKTPLVEFLNPSTEYTETQSSHPNRLTNRSRKLSNRQPPGSVYQKIRAVSGNPNKSFDMMSFRSRTFGRRTASRTLPISLRTGPGPGPEIPVKVDGSPSIKYRNANAFVFRSPMAPVMRRSWQALYSQEQLDDIMRATMTNEIDASAPHSSQPSRQYNQSGYSSRGQKWKVLRYSPQLCEFNLGISQELAAREAKISTTVLIICSIIPPLLCMLYWGGQLDLIIKYRTNGEVKEFSRNHKKLALRIAIVSVVLLLGSIPLILFLGRH